MMRSSAIAAAIFATAWAVVPSTAQEAAQGQTLFRQRCGACHQVDTTRNGVGPHLQGVIGRTAGGVDGYNYSAALKSSGVVWSADTLDTYLANPMAMVRGTRMTQRFTNAAERKAIIDFLSSR